MGRNQPDLQLGYREQASSSGIGIEMNKIALVAIAACNLSACEQVQKAAEDQARNEVSERVDAAEGELRNRLDVDNRLDTALNKIDEAEAATNEAAARVDAAREAVEGR